ncbi:hypothetical protein Droror1_Dr00017159 [Drosera rotundifolia]
MIVLAVQSGPTTEATRPKVELTAMMMLTLTMVKSDPDLRKVVKSRHCSCKHPHRRHCSCKHPRRSPNRCPSTSLPYSVNLRKGVDLVARLLLVSDGMEHHLLVRQPSDSDPEQPQTTSEPKSSHKDARSSSTAADPDVKSPLELAEELTVKGSVAVKEGILGRRLIASAVHWRLGPWKFVLGPLKFGIGPQKVYRSLEEGYGFI